MPELFDVVAAGAQSVRATAAGRPDRRPGDRAASAGAAELAAIAKTPLADLLKVCRDEDLFVVAEGESSTIGSTYGILGQVKASHYGLAFAPDVKRRRPVPNPLPRPAQPGRLSAGPSPARPRRRHIRGAGRLDAGALTCSKTDRRTRALVNKLEGAPMAIKGMDIEAVRGLAGQLNARADEIDSLANALSAQLGNVEWLGLDADGFRGDWQNSYRVQLQTVSAALRDASTRATGNANQQEQASLT